MPPKTSSTRQATMRQPVRSRTVTQISTPDELADKFASKLAISNGTPNDDLSPEETEQKRIGAMRMINATSQALSAIVQSGWKASKPEPQTKGPEPSTLLVEGRTALKDLRSVSPGSLNTERAASSLAGKFIALELYEESLDILSDTHEHLPPLYTSPETSIPPRSQLPTKGGRPAALPSLALQDHLQILSIPLPSPQSQLDPTLLTLLTTYLSQCLISLSYTIFAQRPSPAMNDLVSLFAKILSSTSESQTNATLVPWIQSPVLTPCLPSLPAKYLDSLLTRTYTALAKSSSSTTTIPQRMITQPHPSHILLIRTYGLHCLLLTAPSTIASTTFWDQMVKFVVQFARAIPALRLSNTNADAPTPLASDTKSNVAKVKKVAGAKIMGAKSTVKAPEPSKEDAEAEATKQATRVFDEMYERARLREDHEKFLSGKGFVGFCEYWMGFCKRAGDINALDKVAGVMHAVQLDVSSSAVSVTDSSMPINPSSSKSPSKSALHSAKAEQGDTPEEDGRSRSSSRRRGGAGESTSQVLELAKVCASLSQATMLLEASMSDDKASTDEENLSSRLSEALSAILRASKLVSLSPPKTSAAPSSSATPSTSTVSSRSSEEEVSRAEAKFLRAVERLRRVTIKALESSSASSQSSSTSRSGSPARSDPITRAEIALLHGIVNLLEGVCQERPNEDTITSVLDTLFMLARTALSPSNPDSHISSFDILSQGCRILGITLHDTHDPPTYIATVITSSHHKTLRTPITPTVTPSSTSAPNSEPLLPPEIPLRVYANYVRCVSGAFYSSAAMLYQKEKYGAGSRFLRQGCVLGREALMLWSKCRLEGVDGDVEEGKEGEKEGVWKSLQDGMGKRWELLGVCYSKIGDRKLAYDAFIDCLKSFKANDSVLNVIRTKGGKVVFETCPDLKQVGIIVDRVTYMATCELLRDPAEASLLSVLQQPESSTPTAAAISAPTKSTKGKQKAAPLNPEQENRTCFLGAILERQIDSLESCRWKDTGKTVTARLLSDCISLYEAAKRPIRRVGVLLRCLEFEYYTGNVKGVRFNPEAVGENVEALLSGSDMGFDKDLSHLRTQYQATTHLWLALHAHRRQDPQQGECIIRHVDEACRTLKTLIPSQPTPSAQVSPQKAASGKPAAAGTKRGGLRGAVKAPVASAKARVQRMMKKAPAKGAKDQNPALPMPTEVINKVEDNFDDFQKVVNLIQMTTQLVGLLGYILAKVQLLQVLRRLCRRYGSTAEDHYIKACIDLAHEYVKLGRTERAGGLYNHAVGLVKQPTAGDQLRILFFLRYTESLALTGNVRQSSSMYCEALALCDSVDVEEKKNMSTIERIRIRTQKLERAALAASAFSGIQLSRDDPTTSVVGLLQALRLWNRATSALARLDPPPEPRKTDPEADNPFNMTEVKNALPSAGNDAAAKYDSMRPKPNMDGLEWRIAEGLLSTLLSLAQAYFSQGSPRAAEYFIEQMHDLAKSLNCPAMVSRALAKKGELQLHLGQLEEGHEMLVKAAELLMDMPGPEAADIRRLKGDYSQLNEQDRDAEALYSEAADILEELDKMFSAMDGQGVRRSSITLQGAAGPLVPSLQSAVLRQHIWLLRNDVGEEYQELLNRFLDLPSTPETKAEETALLAKLALYDVHDRFQDDIFLSSLAESTIALPMGMSGNKSYAASASVQEILGILANAEKLFWSNLSAIARRGRVVQVRDAAGSLALIQLYQTSLGKSGAEGAVMVANLLDASASVTLRREMLEVIRNKFPDYASLDDLQWPRITNNGSPIAPSKPSVKRVLQFDSDGEDDTDMDAASLKKYWESVQARYLAQTFDAESLLRSKTDRLPEHWTVAHIYITEDKNTIFITRQRAGRDPLTFCLPLKGRNAMEDEEHLTFNDAVAGLKEIIRLSDVSAKEAINVKADDKDARAAWWADRTELDRRLKELLENIEFCWLGAFKTILSRPHDIPADALEDLRGRLEGLFQRSLVSHNKSNKKQKSRVRLDESIVECFSSLSPKCRDEELEDFLYFILDLYQFHGVSVAIAEVDVDHVVVDLRALLEEHTSKTRGRAVPQEDSHLFLVLDKNVLGLPWESLPILRGQSVSRIPSIDFLIDRLDFEEWRRKDASSGAGHSPIDRAKINPRSTYYVLNPSGDLAATQGRFSPWLKEMHSVGWQGVVGKAPSEQQVLNAMSQNDLFIYFGHGGGEQYVRSQKIRHLPRCAATMLWGCSSGDLKELGEFDRTGTPYHYILAGCPTLVANLWDVTDRDIDKFAQSVFDKLHLTARDVKKHSSGKSSSASEMSVVAAVSEAREACKLKYLTGAAPVVYGIPFYL